MPRGKPRQPCERWASGRRPHSVLRMDGHLRDQRRHAGPLDEPADLQQTIADRLSEVLDMMTRTAGCGMTLLYGSRRIVASRLTECPARRTSRPLPSPRVRHLGTSADVRTRPAYPSPTFVHRVRDRVRRTSSNASRIAVSAPATLPRGTF